MKIQFQNSRNQTQQAESNPTSSGGGVQLLDPSKKGVKPSVLSMIRTSLSQSISRAKQATMKIITSRKLKQYTTKTKDKGSDASGGSLAKPLTRVVPRHERTTGPLKSEPIQSPTGTVYATIVHRSVPLANRPLPPIPQGSPPTPRELIYAELEFTPGSGSSGGKKPVLYENLKNVAPGVNPEPIYAEIEFTPGSSGSKQLYENLKDVAPGVNPEPIYAEIEFYSHSNSSNIDSKKE